MLVLAACSGGPSGREVIAQAAPGGRVAFDVVNIDEKVIDTLQAQQAAAFDRAFKPYVPPPELHIAIGDVISAVVWESGDDGLFGRSLTELTIPAGAAAAARLGRSSPLEGVPNLPGGLVESPGLVATLFGGAAESEAQAGGERAAPLAILPQSAGPLAVGGLGRALSGTGGQTTEAGITGGPQREPFTLAAPGQSRSLAAAAQFPSAPSTALASPSFGVGSRRPAPGGERTAEVERLLDLAAQSGRAGTRIPDQPVGPDGAISIPYAGRVAVAGLTPREAQHVIEARLASRALDPQALVLVKRSAANSVSVGGEVVGGRRVRLSPGGDRLLQVIAAAGGAKAPEHETFVRLSRGDSTATLPLSALIADPHQDIFAEPGDVLTLVRRPQTYSVFGATGKNAAITFTAERMSLAEALAKAGGLDDNRADPRAVFLFRYEPASLLHALGEPVASHAPRGFSPVVYRLDLRQAKSYLLAQRFAVHDKDVIFVADAEIQPLYHFVQALSQVAGPVESALITCQATGC